MKPKPPVGVYSMMLIAFALNCGGAAAPAKPVGAPPLASGSASLGSGASRAPTDNKVRSPVPSATCQQVSSNVAQRFRNAPPVGSDEPAASGGQQVPATEAEKIAATLSQAVARATQASCEASKWAPAIRACAATAHSFETVERCLRELSANDQSSLAQTIERLTAAVAAELPATETPIDRSQP